jgi:hypothetical protein
MSRFVVGGGGWAVNNRLVAAGTTIDTGNAPNPVIPPDATPLDYPTWAYMVSLGVVGMGYDPDLISTAFLVVSPTWPYRPIPPA